MLSQGQAFGGTDIEDGQVGDDLPHTAGSGQGERALWQDLGVALLVAVFLEYSCQLCSIHHSSRNTYHGHDDLGLAGVGNQVHGTANTLDLTGKHKVREVCKHEYQAI